MANSHFRKNAIIIIKVNGVWLIEEKEIREGVAGAFQSLFSDNMVGRAGITSLPFVSLTPGEAGSLEVSFKEEEIFIALNELNGEKAPNLDGFSLAFWQASWLFVKEDIMGFFKEFYEKGTFTKSINTTFLVLIPKKGGVEDLKDFQPISLVGSLYKLLANRLKKVVGKVVSEAQNAFMEGRQITDVSLIVNEVIDYWHKKGEKGVICKLDIEKAYDNIN